ncbi:MAG: hypothetical protein U0795_01525 [Pirellulales bacterium]
MIIAWGNDGRVGWGFTIGSRMDSPAQRQAMMRRSLTWIELGLLVGLVLSSRLAFAEQPAQPAFRVSLIEADVVLGDEFVDAPADESTRPRIEKAIADLAEVPEETLRDYLEDRSGLLFHEFVLDRDRPIDRTNKAEMEPLRYLESQGPLAIPLLLEHLDDTTPVQLGEVVSEKSRFALPRRPDYNPASYLEMRLFSALGPGWNSKVSFPVENGKVRFNVGDICGAVLGAIAGRNYFDHGAMPFDNGAVLIGCPFRRPEVRDILRKHWAETPLYESLLFDYRARIEPATGVGRDDRRQPTSFSRSEGALERLLRYYPELILPDIIRRLDGLNADYEPSGYSSLLETVVWSDNVALRPALIRLIERSDDGYVLATVLRSPVLGADAREKALVNCRSILAQAQSALWWDQSKVFFAIECLMEYEPDDHRLLETMRDFIAAEPERGVKLVCWLRGNGSSRWPVLWPVFRELLHDESVASEADLLDDPEFQGELDRGGVLAEDEYRMLDVVAFHLSGRLTMGGLSYSLDRRARQRRERLRLELIRRGDLLAKATGN